MVSATSPFPSPSSMVVPGVSWPGRFILVLSVLLLIHAGYSALEHITYLKSINRVHEGLTVDIVLETVIAMGLCLYGLILITDPFHEIALESELSKQTRDMFDARPSYRSLSHRGHHFGRVLAQASMQDSKKMYK